MKKFGFGKKKGSSSGTSSPAPSDNPYAQVAPAADPYAQDGNKYANMGPSGPSPYQQARQQIGAGGGLPGGPGPNRTPAANGGGYGAEKYGSGGGYGMNRYDGGDTGSRPGGYGGLGRTNSNDTTTTEDNRDALFGGAKERYVQKTSLPPSNGQPGGGYGAESGAGGGGYGAYGEGRELTAEEEE